MAVIPHITIRKIWSCWMFEIIHSGYYWMMVDSEAGVVTQCVILHFLESCQHIQCLPPAPPHRNYHHLTSTLLPIISYPWFRAQYYHDQDELITRNSRTNQRLSDVTCQSSADRLNSSLMSRFFTFSDTFTTDTYKHILPQMQSYFTTEKTFFTSDAMIF